MSRAIQYAAKCVKCDRLMGPGTEADWFRDGNHYSYFHANGCPDPKSSDTYVFKPQRFVNNFDTRECLRCGEWAFDKGHAPVRCHKCGMVWLTDALEQAA